MQQRPNTVREINRLDPLVTVAEDVAMLHLHLSEIAADDAHVGSGDPRQ
jgi:hypothetical protein